MPRLINFTSSQQGPPGFPGPDGSQGRMGPPVSIFLDSLVII